MATSKKNDTEERANKKEDIKKRPRTVKEKLDNSKEKTDSKPKAVKTTKKEEKVLQNSEDKLTDVVIDKKQNNKIVKTVLVIVGLLVLCGLVFWASLKRDAKGNQNYVEEITIEDYFSLRAGQEKELILLASPTCSWCQRYRPVINKVSSDYGVKVNYLNTGALSELDYNRVYESSQAIIASSGNGVIPTPTTLLVQNGEEVDHIAGYVDYDSLVSFLEKNGLIR